ncbi:MAG TPA: protein kinase, partial [Polyangiaceae bacterium]|nr:protein kinase [Polyangiaceae bacterium]
MQAAARADSEGRRVGRYMIYGELASGGMATVHLGRLLGPVGFSKTVAIKRLHQHLASEPEFVAMLIDEAKLVSSINHPNVVGSLDVVYEDDELLLVMDYIEGETLARLLAPSRQDTALNPPSLGVVAGVVIDVLSGLHAAHTAKTLGGQPLNIVHRDVSPQNIMVGIDGIARVLDFGIAKAEHRRHTTRPGHIKGKFAYMSPEQIRGQRVDARTDVFAAGVVLWECLAKRRLFRVDGDDQRVDGVLTMPILPPSHFDSTISRELDEVVLKALARDAAARFRSAAEFAEALRAVVAEASPVEVGRWVTQAAKRAISDRSDLLSDLETSTINVARGLAVDRFSRTAEAQSPVRSQPSTRPNEPQNTVVIGGRAAAAAPRKLERWSLAALLLAAGAAGAMVAASFGSTASPEVAPGPRPATPPHATELQSVPAPEPPLPIEVLRAEELPREPLSAVTLPSTSSPPRAPEARAIAKPQVEAKAAAHVVTPK